MNFMIEVHILFKPCCQLKLITIIRGHISLQSWTGKLFNWGFDQVSYFIQLIIRSNDESHVYYTFIKSSDYKI